MATVRNVIVAFLLSTSVVPFMLIAKNKACHIPCGLVCYLYAK